MFWNCSYAPNCGTPDAVPMATHSPHDGYPAVAPTRAVQKEIEGIRKSCPDNGAKERKSKQIKSSSFEQ
jgi:hypothetical protein